MTEVLGVLATLDAKPEHADALAEALEQVAAHTRSEEGCLMYEVHRQIDAPARFVVFERWSSEAALAAHIRAPESSAMMMAMADKFASRPSIVKLAPMGG